MPPCPPAQGSKQYVLAHVDRQALTRRKGWAVSASLRQVFQTAAFRQSLLFVLWNPPLGNDFVVAQFSHHRSPLRLKFSAYILNRYARELASNSLFFVRELLESIWLLCMAHNIAACHSSQI